MTITFTVVGSHLHDACAWTSRIVSQRPVIPQLGGLLLDAREDTLTVTAFDLDTRCSATIEAAVTGAGRALLSARLLTAIAKTVARDVDVTITVDDAVATLGCGRSEWSLPVMPVEDFPGLPELDTPVGEVDAAALRHALTRVLPAVHTGGDANVANLSGVKLDGGPESLRLVATDRYRVAVAEIDWKPAGDAVLDALPPADLLEAAARSTSTGTVSLYAGENTFGLRVEGYVVVGRQIAQAYPDLSRFMPVPGAHYAVIDVGELSRAVDEAMVMLDDKRPTLRLDFDGGSVRVTAAGEGRRAQASGRLYLLEGGHIEVGVNAGYLRTALRSLESDAGTVHFTSRAVLLLPSDAESNAVDGFQAVVMRTRL